MTSLKKFDSVVAKKEYVMSQGSVTLIILRNINVCDQSQRSSRTGSSWGIVKPFPFPSRKRNEISLSFKHLADSRLTVNDHMQAIRDVKMRHKIWHWFSFCLPSCIPTVDILKWSHYGKFTLLFSFLIIVDFFFKLTSSLLF